MRLGKIRVEREAAQELSFGSGPIPIVIKVYASKRGVGERQVLVQFQSLHGRRLGFGPGFQWSQVQRVHSRVSLGEARIGKGIVRVELNGLLKVIESFLKLASSGPRQIVAPF